MSARSIPIEPFDHVVFGGAGGLATREIPPGPYRSTWREDGA